MIMPKSSDLLQSGICAGDGLRWRHVDVTDSARALGQAHLCGPAAGLVLAEALGGVALLSGDMTQPDETVSLWMRVDGPVGGLLVEAARDGALRGYTKIKILDDLDILEEPAAEQALGSAGEARIMRAVPWKIISRASFDVVPPSITNTVNRYLAVSLQRMAFAAIVAFAGEDGVDLVRAMLVECLPDGNRDEYERLRMSASDGAMQDALDLTDSGLELCRALGMSEVQTDAPIPLRFACRCERARARAALAALSAAELAVMAAAVRPAEIFCHMCGRSFAFGRDELLLLAQEKGKTSGDHGQAGDGKSHEQ